MIRRPDIDGLRALAVLPVVLFHADVAGFAGGFVGVDVFFVISGFLITGLINDGLADGSFSLASFYERRARRLGPALFTVLFCSIILFAPLLLLNHLHDFANSVIATALFVSNFFFWRITDYFAQPAQFHPLLHTWSLAVEAQFYLLYPLLLIAHRRWLPRKLFIWLLPFTIVGFGVAWVGTLLRPEAAFYLLPTRAWELMLGGLLALGALPRPQSWAVSDGLAILGVGCIAWAVFTHSSDTIFPGPGALLPCIGAALVIHAGSSGRGLVYRVLTWTPIVVVGLMSYSIYLWHWPLLVFAGYWSAAPLDTPTLLGVLALTMILAYLSWRHVERPWRDRRVIRRARTVVLGGTGATAMAVIAGLWLGTVDPSTGQAALALRAPARQVEATRTFVASNSDALPDRIRCHAYDARPILPEGKCDNGLADRPPNVAVWGDSYGAEAGYALGEVAARHGNRLIYSSYSACPPTTRMFQPTRLPCRQHNQIFLDYLRSSPTIETVVLVQRYLAPQYDDTLLDDLADTIRALSEAGKRVVVVGAIPEPYRYVPLVAARQMARNEPSVELGKPRAVFDAETRAVRAWLEQMVKDHDVVVVDPADSLCDEESCALIRNGHPLYFDTHHLTLTVWRELAERFEPYLLAQEGSPDQDLQSPEPEKI